MSSYLKSFLGLKPEAEQEQKETTRRGLPATWYWNPDLYQLERRAIFSKSWILVTHKIRFQEAGDYLLITEAGFSFILIQDRKGQIGGFHNVCRHRGFPLVHNDEGKVNILSCKYHGWSYGLDGRLAKAPHFENFSDFDKTQNALLPIHVHIDAKGFIWVNLEASDVPSISWDEQLVGVDTQKRMDGYDFSEYHFDHIWQMDGDYNWKTLADNYNECLHCRTSHPDTIGLVEIDSYQVDGERGHLQHLNKRQAQNTAEGKLTIASTYYFPNACMTVAPEFFYMMRCVPVSATKVSMEYEVYRHKDATDEAFNTVDQFFKRVLSEDKWLCNNTQKNLQSRVYVNGQMHPNYESGPLYFQQLVKEAVAKHFVEEKKMKKEIWPAEQKMADLMEKTSQERDFCEGLSCTPSVGATLAW